MPIKQISYTAPSITPHSPDHDNGDGNDTLSRTFVLNVDEDVYETLLKGRPEECSMTHDQFQILKFQSDGTLAPATRNEMWHAFDHRDEYYVAYFIAQKGHLDGAFPKPNELHNEIFA
jgi:hypothetical protein